MLAFEADKMSFDHLEMTSLDSESLSVDQAVRGLAAGGFEDIAECLPGDAHFFRGCFLIEALQVGEADRFELVQSEDDFFE